SKDPEVCGKEKMSPDLVVGSDGALANVVVTVEAQRGKKLELPAQDRVFDQKTCEYKPHVLLFPAGSTVDVLNSDGILHNIHTFGTANPPSNQAQPKFKPKIQIKVEKPETIPVKCDVHGWMSAWWVATDQPYVALTDATGAFKITESARLHPLRDRRPQIRLHRLWSERALHRVPREPRVARAVEPEEPPRDRVLAHEVAAEEPRVVGVDRYAHARLPELSQRMRV